MKKIVAEMFLWKEKFPPQKIRLKIFIKKKFSLKFLFEKTFFSIKHFEVNFFYKQYITKKFHKNLSKKLEKKKNSTNFHFNF